MQMGLAGGLLVASMRTSAGETTVGDFVAVQLYILQLFQPLANLGGTCMRDASLIGCIAHTHAFRILARAQIGCSCKP